MAYRSFTLPPLKLTKRPASGATTKKDVHRVTKQQPAAISDGQVVSMELDESTGSGDIGDFFYTGHF